MGPCEGSAITCLLIGDLYEWHNEGLAVSSFKSMKLISPCRSGDTYIRREDPMELSTPRQPMLKTLKQKTKPNETCPNVFGWGDRGETQNPHVEREHLLSQLRAPALINRNSDQLDPA